jgi:hypothetical protein
MRYEDADFQEYIRLVLEGKRHDLYKKCCDHAEEMGIHIYGNKPTEILKRVRPREPEEIRKYREDNYEATTKATASRALSVLAKIFNPDNYSIKWQNMTTNGTKLQSFALENYPKHNSIVKFLSQAGLKRMIADPNGVFAIRLKEVPETDTETPEPEVKVFGSPAIWFYDDEHFLIHIKEEDIRGRKWHYFQYYDDEKYVDFHAQIVNSKRVDVVEDDSYVHALGQIPVWFLTGETETCDNGMEYYTSFFEPALPFWNKAINHESDLDAAFIMHLHPQKVIVGEECDYVDAVVNQRCMNGRIPDGKGGTSTCPACKGAGRVVPVGPFGVHVVPREKLQEGAPVNQPVSYVTVPTEPTEMLKTRVDEQHQKGLAALNMDVIDKVGENQSGVAKVIDRGELYGFLSKISDVLFDTHLQNFFYFFNLYMFKIQDSNPGRNVEANLPEINKPVQFDLSSPQELTLGFDAANKGGMDKEVLRQKQIAIVAKEHASEPTVKSRIITILELDPLPGMSATDVDLNLQAQTISKKDAILHTNIAQFVDRAILEKKDGFWTMDKEAKLKLLQGYADQFIKENKVSLTVEDEEDDAGGTFEQPGKKVA